MGDGRRSVGAVVSEGERERMVREVFARLADEFLRRVDTTESGRLTVHYQNGMPMTREYGFSARIQYNPR